MCNIITRLSHRHPRLKFQVYATDTATAYQLLVARKLDLAIVHVIKPPAEDVVDVETLLQDPHVVVVGAHNPLARRRRIKLAQLADEPWVLPLAEQPYGTVVNEVFRTHGLTVPATIVGSTLPLRTALLLTGPFLSMVPRVVMQFPPKNRLLRTLPIDLPGTERPLALATLKNRTLNPLAQLFADYAGYREAARQNLILQRRDLRCAFAMTSASLTGRSILLIEDEPLIAIAIQQELQDEGAKVPIVRTLASASGLLQNEELSAAIVDLGLADGEAGEICAVFNARRIPFIVHSGYRPCRDIPGAAAHPQTNRTRLADLRSARRFAGPANLSGGIGR